LVSFSVYLCVASAVTTSTTTITSPLDNITNNTSSELNPISENQSHNNYELSFDTKNMTDRSAQEEWQPHQGQTAISQEWWYITVILYDSSGNKYLLFNTLFKLDGKDVPIVQHFFPQMASMLGLNRTIILPLVELSNYNTGFHFYDSDKAIVDPKQIWNPKTNTLSYSTSKYTGSWSFDGDNMTAVLKSQKLSYDLSIRGAGQHQQTMWAKDRTYNKEGFIQEGLPGNVSFYYSLPRLFVSGNLTYSDQLGVRKTIDVSGLGWVDRQWGNFKTNTWEWNSFRFDDGARLNLYNFANA